MRFQEKLCYKAFKEIKKGYTRKVVFRIAGAVAKVANFIERPISDGKVMVGDSSVRLGDGY